MCWKPPASSRRRRVADLAVRARGLALRLGRGALGGARLGAVGLVGGLDLRRPDGADDRVDVEPLDARERDREVVVVLHHQRRREPAELQRAEHRMLELGRLQAGRHDRPARLAGRGDARARLGRERHAAAAEAHVAAGRAGRRVAAADVLLGVLGQPDGDEPPPQLGAVAPAQHGVRRGRRVRPRAPRIREVGDLHLHDIEAIKVYAQLSSPAWSCPTACTSPTETRSFPPG